MQVHGTKGLWICNVEIPEHGTEVDGRESMRKTMLLQLSCDLLVMGFLALPGSNYGCGLIGGANAYDDAVW